MMQRSKTLNMMHAQALKHVHLNTCDMKCMQVTVFSVKLLYF